MKYPLTKHNFKTQKLFWTVLINYHDLWCEDTMWSTASLCSCQADRTGNCRWGGQPYISPPAPLLLTTTMTITGILSIETPICCCLPIAGDTWTVETTSEQRKRPVLCWYLIWQRLQNWEENKGSASFSRSIPEFEELQYIDFTKMTLILFLQTNL